MSCGAPQPPSSSYIIAACISASLLLGSPSVVEKPPPVFTYHPGHSARRWRAAHRPLQSRARAEHCQTRNTGMPFVRRLQIAYLRCLICGGGGRRYKTIAFKLDTKCSHYRQALSLTCFISNSNFLTTPTRSLQLEVRWEIDGRHRWCLAVVDTKTSSQATVSYPEWPDHKDTVT